MLRVADVQGRAAVAAECLRMTASASIWPGHRDSSLGCMQQGRGTNASPLTHQVVLCSLFTCERTCTPRTARIYVTGGRLGQR